jgi:hypothetical protein
MSGKKVLGTVSSKFTRKAWGRSKWLTFAKLFDTLQGTVAIHFRILSFIPNLSAWYAVAAERNFPFQAL